MKNKDEAMNDCMMVVLTENVWLYTGLANLLPEISMCNINFRNRSFPENICYSPRVIIAVDSLINFHGNWKALELLCAIRPDASLVWMTRNDTGYIILPEYKVHHIINQRKSINSMRLSFRRFVNIFENKSSAYQIQLTKTESELLPYFLEFESMKDLSLSTGINIKTLYTHRQKIKVKVGFRNITFLKLAYKNAALSGVLLK